MVLPRIQLRMYIECGTSVSSIRLITRKSEGLTQHDQSIRTYTSFTTHHLTETFTKKWQKCRCMLFSLVLWFSYCYMQLDRHCKAHRHIFATLPCEHATKRVKREQFKLQSNTCSSTINFNIHAELSIQEEQSFS